MGGYDIYKTEYAEGRWTTPENLGYPINSSDNDIFFVISYDNKRGYYASAKDGGFGKNDIYMITMLPPVKYKDYKPLGPKKIAVSRGEYKVAGKEYYNAGVPFTIFKGNILDEKTKQPLDAQIIVTDLNNRIQVTTVSSGVSGEFEIPLLSGVDYGIEVEKEGYLFMSEHLDIPYHHDFQIYIKYVELKKMEVGVKVVLKNVFFDFDKATLKPQSITELNVLKELLLANPHLKIEISGHTDNIGSELHNLKLSQARAKTVADYLVKNGIKTERLRHAGYGKAKPVASNDTEEGRQLNRRTEFEIIEK